MSHTAAGGGGTGSGAQNSSYVWTGLLCRGNYIYKYTYIYVGTHIHSLSPSLAFSLFPSLYACPLICPHVFSLPLAHRSLSQQVSPCTSLAQARACMRALVRDALRAFSPSPL